MYMSEHLLKLIRAICDMSVEINVEMLATLQDLILTETLSQNWPKDGVFTNQIRRTKHETIKNFWLYKLFAHLTGTQ